MTDITVDFFSFTTVDDENNYFSGSIEQRVRASEGAYPQLPPGVYRVIDGELCRIVSGLTPDDVRHKLNSAQ